MPNKCAGVPLPKFIAIRGERHSATNLFRQITNRNGKFQQSCTRHNDLRRCDQYLGWKHGYLDSKLDVIEEDVITAVMVRDAFSWIVSMFYEPYNMIMNENTDNFGIFLKSPYNATCEHNIAYIKDNCLYPMEQADNLLEMRTKKYKNWIDFLSSPVNETKSYQWSIIRQEDLVGLHNQEQTTKTFFQHHCIQSRSSKFKIVGKFVTKSLQSNNVAHRDILNWFTIEELRYVLDNLDLKYEKDTLGYDYGYVVEHINKRTQGDVSHQYQGPPKLNDETLPKRMKHIEDNIHGRIPGRDISIEEYEQIHHSKMKTIGKK